MAANYDNLLAFLSEPPSPSSAKNESALLEPYTYITATPGKEIRAEMIAAFNNWLNVPAPKLQLISRVVSMLHNASLLVDDIEDDSQLRRGQPVAHKIYGVPQTINTANYVYFLAYKELFALRSSAVSSAATGAGPSSGEVHTAASEERLYSDVDLDRIVTDELLNLHRGQGLELLWRDSLSCPTEEEYIGMVNNKTGGLFRVAVKLMMACATTNPTVDYVPLVNLIGVYFQIRDDYMNLQSNQYATNKGFAEDLTEGKFSFPIVHAVRADTSNRQVLNVLQKRPTTPTLKTHTIAYLKTRTKSFDYTLQVLRKLETQVHAEIQRLGGNPKLQAIVDALHVKDEE
ncbi:terpenoid synthase [Dentipellis sp. KUC8613]|nr:terpenoid synthase [Dentipellis sp. KUC8613]